MSTGVAITATVVAGGVLVIATADGGKFRYGAHEAPYFFLPRFRLDAATEREDKCTRLGIERVQLT